MNIFNRSIKALPFYIELEKAFLKRELPCLITGVSSVHKAHLINFLGEEKKALCICDDESSARRIVSDINEMAGFEKACFFPAKDFVFTNIEGVSREYEYKRLEALSKIQNGVSHILVASIEACMQGTIPPQVLKSHTFEIACGKEYDLSELVSKLISSGYTRCDQIDGQAQFSVRGSILDVFSVSSNLPIRIEFWGDEVDSVSYFEIESQRRCESVDKVEISPALEVLFETKKDFIDKLTALSNSVSGKNKELIRKHLLNDLDMFKNGISLSNIDKYYAMLYEKVYTVFDYFSENDFSIICEYSNCLEKAKAAVSQQNEDLKILFEDGNLSKELSGFSIDIPSILLNSEKMLSITLDTFMRSNVNISYKKLITANAMQTSGWSGDIKQLIEDLKSFSERKYCTVVLAGSEKTAGIIASDLREEGINAALLKEDSEILDSTVYVCAGSVSGGFEYPDTRFALITQTKTLASKKKIKKRKKSEEINSISEITEGDLVVHSLYGIGRFCGIKKIEVNKILRDYIMIKYAGTDVLYVPVTQLDLVSRYIGQKDDTAVKLNKLNSGEWQKTRSKVKSAVKDMADELIKLYAKRQASKGFQFSEDNDWQMDFEERFDYQETDDQLRSIEEIKQDMQKPIPMDRLLCGDVGFGKTEVAFRAAFKCMLDSKQCAILVPTTVLAWQHYQSALKRFEHFPIKVELLSRFRTPKQQAQILRQLKRGEIDLIIGTHRLVQKDVEFKDLGLVIIDEEQRFGVAHKEKFKEAFTGVDVLTLSATPIPRTLNMAMSGIRDMSVIEEPPQDRYPVQTYVVEHNPGVIAQAIQKELRRGGQVYYIHNRIETIEQCAHKLSLMLPDARIAFAHGQIGEQALSEIWRQLIDKEIDILVCTTIIETGVDVPNVNTLIIEDADRLGLSQLYQLRGRVGRSNRRAFAYFTFKRGKVLSEIAAKRLDAIRQFTQFGSGFRIAMRDLEIRGAGSILSAKQHGHLEAVGYDMYIRLLNEALAEQRGEAPPTSPEDCLVDVAIEAYIPEGYIESLSQRIDAYRKIASIRTKEDSMDVIDELIDRYGDPPKAVTGLINIAFMRNTASGLGITEISQRGENMLFFIKSPSPEQIKSMTDAFRGRILFNGSGKSYISVKLLPKQKSVDLMSEVIEVMSNSRPK